jgi:branched-chain amino acid transport system ATP-binding protein
MTTGTLKEPPRLDLTGVTAGYGRTTVLRDVSVSVGKHEVVALIGANGAGKTTLLRVAAGLIQAERGAIKLDDDDITTIPADRRARRGVCLVPEGHGVFPGLTVAENLRLQVPRGAKADAAERVLSTFPALQPRMSQRAGSLSGGQQQMLALGRCLASSPRVVLVDEASMGLAPLVVDEIFAALASLAREGLSLLLVEQYVHRALEMADRIYIMDRGAIAFSGAPDEMSESEIMAKYLSVDAQQSPPSSG